MKVTNTKERHREYVAILGFAKDCSFNNKVIAFEIGEMLSTAGYVLAAGNITSTFYSAFMGAKKCNGNTFAILEKESTLIKPDYCDAVLCMDSADEKHKKIAELCSGAIIIGGGNGTKHLEQLFLKLNKPVVAIKSTGGITRTELDRRTKCVSNIEKTLTLIN